MTRVALAVGGGVAIIACTLAAAKDDSMDQAEALSATDGGADAWVDCVGALHVVELRGVGVSNAARVGAHDGASLSIGELPANELRAFCDWEACIRANGYGHICALNDAGWESCRVCKSADDCDGAPMSQDECVAHAADVGRATCQVDLLEECLLQHAIRGPADRRPTQACERSARACAGNREGDRLTQASEARIETGQIAVEAFAADIAIELARNPTSAELARAQATLDAWDGGRPPYDDAAATDAGMSDAAHD